jgi:hypothetical protein
MSYPLAQYGLLDVHSPVAPGLIGSPTTYFVCLKKRSAIEQLYLDIYGGMENIPTYKRTG